jgi:hypothetical protein
LMNPEDQKIIKSVKSEVNVWMKKFPLYTK